MSSCELYRGNTLGRILTDVLDDFITRDVISASLAMKVLLQYDKTISNILCTKIKAKSSLKVQSYIKILHNLGTSPLVQIYRRCLDF